MTTIDDALSPFVRHEINSSPDLVLVMSFDDLVLLLPVRRIAFQRRIAVFGRHPLVGVDGFQVGGLSCGALLLDSIGERDIVGKGTGVAHLSQPTPTLRNLRAVQILLGHESIATTERYTAVDDSEIRAAMTAALDDAI